MSKWTAAELPDLSGRTVIVTGASSGIGLVTARELARVGARVVLAVRDVAKGEAASAGITGRTEVRRLDVSSLESVRAFATEWTGEVDVLVNNAGVMDVPLSRTADGLDLQTATNYFGPFALTNLLLPRITDRVVHVASQLHRMGHARPEDLNWERRPYKPMDAYSDSKLDLLLFSLELQRRLTEAGSPVRSMVAHPGIATTSLASRSAANRINKFRFFLNDPEHGALPTLFAATQDLPGNSYIGPDGPGGIKGHPKVGRPSRAARDTEAAGRLWAATALLTGTAA
ncbi:NAD(P)-dependent dehydrogenase (short-subunit alcohol dehydrogenase family) [Kitasatospora sp. GAS204A]|uniref:oxidoreductase n=1 Tax=unclassified Kitasatospora TaxID=2633591 RepID=UPI0024742328|nr:oxidoreductase [Kitasatospora sp. GAS204B]MDH6120858.1 NAD(P)-dependent dehydrogenase (short-subunit alcohol dehydrogenase family) [Kitasatospora sp. GAS204B]